DVGSYIQEVEEEIEEEIEKEIEEEIEKEAQSIENTSTEEDTDPATILPHKCGVEDINTFMLAMRLWCKDLGISRE
ncbi:hypothetical protein FQN55_002874, partial [Onygenales sp. PD_40]